MSFAPQQSRTGPLEGPAAAVIRTVGAVGVLCAAPSGSAAQERVVDSGSFAILRAGELVGLEEFQLRRITDAAGGDVFTLSTTASYPADQPTLVLSALLRLRGDSLVSSARLELQHEQRSAVALLTVGDRRVTVRIGVPGLESSREYPGATPSVLLDDSLFGLHALRHPQAAAGISLLWARAGQRSSGAVTFHGRTETDVGDTRRTLEHVSLGTGDAVRHLWFDDQGRLQKVEAPRIGLTAIRRPGR